MQDRSANSVEASGLSRDFSLVIGGPLFQLLRRSRLSDDAAELVQRRIIAFIAITWLPLLLITALQGNAWRAEGAVPFLLDFEVHTRFLIALPLLILAELVVHRRMRLLVRQFEERKLVSEKSRAAFAAALTSAVRLRNSVSTEVLLVALVYGLGIIVIWRNYVALDAATWYASHSANGSRLSIAGIWYGYVSLPIFQFLLCRWYFRLFLWARFLWHVSRLELNLLPTHPDRTAGLGFLTNISYSFIPVLAAHGVLLAGIIGSRIYHLGASLPMFKLEIAVLVVFLLCLILGPLLVFSFKLADAKRKGQREYGMLAERYAREFDAKWLRGGAPEGEQLIGSADIQSLADLGNSYEVVRGMRMVPFGKDAVLQLSIATVAPILPLVLTMMPLEELLKRLAAIIF